MSIRENNKKFLADFMYQGQRYRRQYPTYEEAAAWEAELRRRMRLSLPYAELIDGKGTSMLLTELLDKTYERFWENTSNQKKQLSNMKIIEEHFGEGCRIADVSTTALDDFVFSMERRNLAPSTINSRINTLSKAFNFALDREYIEKLPKFERKKTTGNARIRFFTEEEEIDILDALDGDGRYEFAAYTRWMLDTGMRPIEARNATASSVRYDAELGWLIDLRKTKNCYPRTILLTKRAVEAFEFLNTSERPFAHFTETVIRRNWEFVRGCTGDTDTEYVFYLCRHTCASRLVQRRVQLQIVKEWMGHKSFEQTLRYAKLFPSNMLDGRKALEQTLH
jgi:integrase